MTKWTRAQYAMAYVDLCDAVVMQKSGSSAEDMIKHAVSVLAAPDYAGMLDFAAQIPPKPPKPRTARGRDIMDLRVGELPRAAAEAAVSTAINLCLAAREKEDREGRPSQ
jgi:hypothetical protein